MNISLLEQEVPFDQFSRQFQVLTILDKLREKDQKYKVLDVGGHNGRTADFLSEDNVTVMDLYDVKAENYVRGSALDMPFANGSFDYILSFDVLEHIPAVSRKKFFDECARVARDGVIICAPNKTPANEFAEKSLDDLYGRLHDESHPWLKEHIEYGIPDFEEVAKYASSHGWYPATFRSNKTLLWAAMQEAIFLNSKYSLASEYLTDINKFYNQNFKYDGGGQNEAAYRVILCSLKSEIAAKLIVKELGSLSKPIDSKLELELLEKITEFNFQLVQKTTALADDYRELHVHEKIRADTLHKYNEELLLNVSVLEKKLKKHKYFLFSNRVKQKIKKRKQQ